ncbi:hypothetical protein HD554DRAFT_2023241, partial [Boletus coccyginus]
PLHIEPLGGQVELVIKEKGWSKGSWGMLRKINSFLEESQCFGRKQMAIKDFTFSDGTFITQGNNSRRVLSRCLHLDNEHYDNAHVFGLVQFSNMCDEEGGDTKRQFVSTGMEKHARISQYMRANPGRLFAANELTSMLARVVMSWDVKLEDNRTRRHCALAIRMSPDPVAKIMLRRGGSIELLTNGTTRAFSYVFLCRNTRLPFFWGGD